ncbi:AAA family ATPase [Elizabethkingia anophelis]|uniref:AAA family ATPase n=1 Tax=Elizabethkingia anophelis TaxID=1117645 RepID=UPI000B34BF5B|nr:AAA family ATPase [Elizabethkingia anophelis]MCL1034967.1 AAA family ATPase [Elizabethkingia anophelis]
MLNVNTVHNEVYNLLIKHWQKDSSFRFTFRKSNRESRLDKGYWFYGNEWYLAVSFWTGMDWKNKTPNIIFIILLDSGNTYLEINTSDSDEKRRFITQFFVNELELQSNGIRYQKHYQGNYLESLENFIKTDKILIDNIISEHAVSFFPIIKNGIFFIEAADFEGQKEKIDRYREHILIENSIETQKPVKISEIEIVNYGPIKNLQINEIPFSSQWIFFTGENGTGKTSILRAIATAICNQKIQVSGFEDENAEISLKLFLSSSDTITYLYPYNQTLENDTFPLTNGFAAYGQSRLKTTHGLDSKNLEFISTELTSSLFNDETHLIDLQYQFDIWRSQQRIRFDKRENYITEILTDILPNLYDIKFDDQIDGVSATTYIEKDHENAEFAKVTFNKLASGLKSMIAMIGDILIRLYNQQPDVNDPSEFTGIVLIDEIDIHLHPKLQKQIVQQLSKTFPKVQFIASTHSPISFLGAPKNSQIFRVERNSAEGVKIRRLDELLELGDLLPNTILTSPIFGLDDIIPESHDQKKLVRTETNYSEIEFNDIVQKRISSFLTDEKEQQLIDLFKSRRQ